MTANALKFTTHEGVSKIVPLDAVRIIKPMTDGRPQQHKKPMAKPA